MHYLFHRSNPASHGHIYLYYYILENQHHIYALDIPVVSDINHTLRNLQYWEFNLYHTYSTLMHCYFNDTLKLLKHNKCHHIIKKIEKKMIFLVTFYKRGCRHLGSRHCCKVQINSLKCAHKCYGGPCMCNELLPNSIRGRRGLSPLAICRRTPASRHGRPRTR